MLVTSHCWLRQTARNVANSLKNFILLDTKDGIAAPICSATLFHIISRNRQRKLTESAPSQSLGNVCIFLPD